MPDVGLVELEDAETGREMLVDTSDPEFRYLFRQLNDRAEERRDQVFRSVGIDRVDIHTGSTYVDALMRFFRKRAQQIAA